MTGKETKIECASLPAGSECVQVPAEDVKPARDIVRFKGAKQAAVSLDHIQSIFLDGKSITIEFSAKSQVVDCESEESAASIFEGLLITWAG